MQDKYKSWNPIQMYMAFSGAGVSQKKTKPVWQAGLGKHLGTETDKSGHMDYSKSDSKSSSVELWYSEPNYNSSSLSESLWVGG